MSMYSELLRLALQQAQQARDFAAVPVGELVDDLVVCRLELDQKADGAGPGARRGAEWTADLIAHDVALVRLCQRLGIEHHLLDGSAPPTERERVLALLAEQQISTG